MVGGVGLHDSEGAPAEMQEFLVEQFGETVYGCGNHRAGKAYLGLGVGGSLSREVGGVFEGCRQRSVSFEVAKIVGGAVLGEVVAGLDNACGHRGKHVDWDSFDFRQTGVRPARLVEGGKLQGQDPAAVKGEVNLQHPRHGGGHEHESEERFQRGGHAEPWRGGQDVASQKTYQ